MGRLHSGRIQIGPPGCLSRPRRPVSHPAGPRASPALNTPPLCSTARPRCRPRARRELQARYGLETNRRVPDWGAAIFSPLCVLMRPETDADLAAFLKYTIALAQYHAQVCRLMR